MKTLYTIGHSTRTLPEFVAMLKAHDIRRLIDVRTLPGSRYNPQFNRERLSRFLRNRKINYRHMKSLGGLRRPKKDSINTAWRNRSFRGYADYMQTAEFKEAARKLMTLAREKKAVIMCAEAVPWRCHRSLIADALIAKGFRVFDIYSLNSCKPHTLSKMAKICKGGVVYP